jgi:hypothetical protein
MVSDYGDEEIILEPDDEAWMIANYGEPEEFPAHALPPAPQHTPEWVEAEAKRLYPLDLVGRLEWMQRMAWNAATPTDRDRILRLTRRLRGM